VKGRKLRRLASVPIISQFLAAFEATTFPQQRRDSGWALQE
jgi:hypothetical protein